MDDKMLAREFSQEQDANPFRFLYENIFSVLANEIARMEISPGEELQEKALAEVLHVSRTPIRQAFSELEKIDFVTLTPRSGCIVSGIGWEELIEFAALRKAIEPACAFLTATQATREEVEELGAILEKSRRENVARIGDFTTPFVDLENSFHSAICTMSKNKYLIKVYRDMYRELTRTRYFFARKLMDACIKPVIVDNRTTSSYDEHLVIYQAIKAGNSELARNAMAQHLERLIVKIPENAR